MDSLTENTDEIVDVKPTLYLDDRQVRIQKLDKVKVGHEIEVMGKAKVKSVDSREDEDGIPRTSITLELDDFTCKGPHYGDKDSRKIYPTMMED